MMPLRRENYPENVSRSQIFESRPFMFSSNVSALATRVRGRR
jgi:hypothetical protein